MEKNSHEQNKWKKQTIQRYLQNKQSNKNNPPIFEANMRKKKTSESYSPCTLWQNIIIVLLLSITLFSHFWIYKDPPVLKE